MILQISIRAAWRQGAACDGPAVSIRREYRFTREAGVIRHA
jgi:hypothetical protein